MIQRQFGNCRHRCTLSSLLALTLVIVAGPVGAVTLDDFAVLSTLNSPLLATAQLRLGPDDEVGAALEARLASFAAHRDAGIEVGEVHRNLVATLEETGSDGTRQLRITTGSTRVTEPFLQFIVQLRWQNGGIERTATLLIDPPGYRLASSAPTDSTPEPDATASAPPPRGATQQRNEAEGRGALPRPGERYRVQVGDSLWTVAARIETAQPTSQTARMDRVFRSNPSAFFNQDPNRLKAGAILRIPTGAAMLEPPASSDSRPTQPAKDRAQAPAPAGAAHAQVETGGVLVVESKPEPGPGTPPPEPEQTRSLAGTSLPAGSAGTATPTTDRESLRTRIELQTAEIDRLRTRLLALQERMDALRANQGAGAPGTPGGLASPDAENRVVTIPSAAAAPATTERTPVPRLFFMGAPLILALLAVWAVVRARQRKRSTDFDFSDW